MQLPGIFELLRALRNTTGQEDVLSNHNKDGHKKHNSHYYFTAASVGQSILEKGG